MKTHAVLASLLMLSSLGSPGIAAADSGDATISRLPESEQLQASAEVKHECPAYSTEPSTICVWFADATQYPANTECPPVYDGSHGVWVGPVESVPGTSFGTFAFAPHSPLLHLCLYVNAEGSSFVGQSYPFDVSLGVELTPPKPDPELVGLRFCERPNGPGAFMAASPNVSCGTARVVRSRVFGRAFFSTRSTPCENRTYCVVRGFRCWGKWEGRLRPFSYAHHASCRAGRRRIVIDIG